MATTTSIEWTDVTWNPVTGCSKVSPGCAHCYAEGVALRFWPTQYPKVETVAPNRCGTLIAESRPRAFTDVMTHDDRLDQPLRWKKPRKVFVNSMSDLFHEDVPDYFIARVFSVMAWARQHTFQVLTKRADRMRALLSSAEFRAEVAEFVEFWLHDDPEPPKALQWDPSARRSDDARATQPDIEGADWPLPNVWLGVSVENQHFADERIPLLLQTPAAVRFISAEPLLGPVNLERYMWPTCWHWAGPYNTPEEAIAAGAYAEKKQQGLVSAHCRFLDWVIVGGESGAGARPCRVQWVREVVAQCKAAGVPVFVKQLGSNIVTRNDDGFEGDTPNGWPMDTAYEANIHGHRDDFQGADVRVQLRDRKGGDMAEWPADLRVRCFPSFVRGLAPVVP